MTDADKAKVQRMLGQRLGQLTLRQLVDLAVTLKDATEEEMDELGLSALRDI
jgi:hypothetical protein